MAPFKKIALSKGHESKVRDSLLLEIYTYLNP